MNQDWKRRDFLTLTGLGGLVFASGLTGCASSASEAKAPGIGAGPRPAATSTAQDFFFLQLSDTHWGFEGPPNPEAATCLKQTVAAINQVETQPELIVFTGDLTHKTDDAQERRARMAQFREIVGGLRTKKLIFLPGEHDAAADAGEAYHAAFGDLYQSFAHGGVSFIALDNASAPGGTIGDSQLAWLEAEVAKVPTEAPLVVLAHRPLFDLYPEWDWATKDGARALELISRHQNTTVFYGHIHQEHHHMTGAIAHHSARSLIFPLPAPGAAPKRVPLAWDPASSDHGIGHRAIRVGHGAPVVTEVPFVDQAKPTAAAAAACEQPAVNYDHDVKPVLERRCFSCHTGDGAAADDHDFSRFDHITAARRDIGRQVAAHAMPPGSRPALPESEAALLLKWATCAT